MGREKFGKAVGFKRNVQIIDYSYEVLTFQVDNSNETAHSVGLVEKQGKPVKVVEISLKAFP